MTIRFMHTLDNEPAYFDGRQIVYRAGRNKVLPLASSLEQIRVEQKASGRFCEAKGWPVPEYDHVRVEI